LDRPLYFSQTGPRRATGKLKNASANPILSPPLILLDRNLFPGRNIPIGPQGVFRINEQTCIFPVLFPQGSFFLSPPSGDDQPGNGNQDLPPPVPAAESDYMVLFFPKSSKRRYVTNAKNSGLARRKFRVQ
jgi:hypothetical protein